MPGKVLAERGGAESREMPALESAPCLSQGPGEGGRRGLDSGQDVVGRLLGFRTVPSTSE